MVALIENLQRQDLDFIEEARGIGLLMERYGLTQEQAAQAHLGAVCGYLIAPGSLSFKNVYDKSERVVEPLEINSKYNAAMCGWTTNAELMRVLNACYGICDSASLAPYYGVYGYTTNGSMCNETNLLVMESASTPIINNNGLRSTITAEIAEILQTKPSTIQTRLAKARDLLKMELE